MCVMSMIMDHYDDKWRRLVPPFVTDPNTVPVTQTVPIPPYVPQQNPPWAPPPYVQPVPYLPPLAPLITQEEVDEFHRLLERAREYDRTHAQPDCEMEEKRQKIKDLATQLGVDVSFV